ncbi:hypothetical protein PINS_up006540 [Pythium insidiosum]|nr:hypothetical protein PINS_up006540 [Pythium insidiosum]
MYGSEIRWQAVTLVYAYAVPVSSVARILGVSERAVRRWYNQFIRSGHVMPAEQERRDWYPADVIEFISSYVASHPCFFVEELQSELKVRYAHLGLRASHATILRVLHDDLKLTRKVLEPRAREAAPMEILTYKAKLAAFYTYPEQLIFIDETA